MAFPRGIPAAILEHRVDHRQPHPGDQGFQFQRRFGCTEECELRIAAPSGHPPPDRAVEASPATPAVALSTDVAEKLRRRIARLSAEGTRARADHRPKGSGYCEFCDLMENPEPVEAPFWPAPAGSGEAVQAMLCVEGLQHWVVEHGRALQPEQWCDALFGREKLEDCLDAGGHVDDRTWNRIRQVDSAFRRNAALVIDAVGACGYSTERRSRFWRGLIACARWSGR